jgi:putative transposase
MIKTIFHYQKDSPPRLSHLDRHNASTSGTTPLVQIIAYCLLPNHFHLLLKQQKENGISKYMANLTNSYARYFNPKHKRRGPLFEGRFKAVRIETDQQLLHVNRYIHLNPYSSFLTKTVEQLFSYPYSSLPQYLKNGNSDSLEKEIILDFFKTPSSYKEFLKDQADYQRQLDIIKHLTLD